MKREEIHIEWTFRLFAFSSLLFLFLILFFILFEGSPLLYKVGLRSLLLEQRWAPTKGSFGILPMVVSSFLVTFGALCLGAPLGLFCAIFLSEYASRSVRMVLKPTLELLAAIPSVVYGFMGVVYLVPIVREYLGGPGFSLLTTSLVLGIMILPTITSISFDAMQSVPGPFREGSYAMGATRWQTIWRITLPSARSGIVAGFILGMGRAIGETMAVIMVAGNALSIPRGLLEPLRTLTGNIALELAYATGEHRSALFTTGVILLLIIMIFNSVANFVVKKRIVR
jgi:phosphate ABC transporter permease protein PstC